MISLTIGRERRKLAARLENSEWCGMKVRRSCGPLEVLLKKDRARDFQTGNSGTDNVAFGVDLQEGKEWLLTRTSHGCGRC